MLLIFFFLFLGFLFIKCCMILKLQVCVVILDEIMLMFCLNIIVFFRIVRIGFMGMIILYLENFFLNCFIMKFVWVNLFIRMMFLMFFIFGLCKIFFILVYKLVKVRLNIFLIKLGLKFNLLVCILILVYFDLVINCL